MDTIDFKFDPKSIDPTEQTPFVSTLLFWAYIESLYTTPTASSACYLAIITQTTFGVGYRYIGRTIELSFDLK